MTARLAEALAPDSRDQVRPVAPYALALVASTTLAMSRMLCAATISGPGDADLESRRGELLVENFHGYGERK